MLFLELTVINKWWAVSLWQPSLTWVRSRYCSFPRPIHVLICCNFSRLIEIQWRESYRKFWFLSFYVFLDTCLNWYQLNTYLYTKEFQVAYVWFPYFYTFSPSQSARTFRSSFSLLKFWRDLSWRQYVLTLISRYRPDLVMGDVGSTPQPKASDALIFLLGCAQKMVDGPMPQFRSKSKC